MVLSVRAEGKAPLETFTSKAIEPSTYRVGEVLRVSAMHGGCRAVCDEVTRLMQRFCDLRLASAAPDRALAAALPVGFAVTHDVRLTSNCYAR
jgi:hypothetical protein